MIQLIHPFDDDTAFSDTEQAALDPNGLLAIGGQLSAKRLLMAYESGIFPWYNSDDEPILWWSPDPRLVLFPASIKISRSLRKTLKKTAFTITFDQAFEQVIDGCAAPRSDGEGTWITSSMRSAYLNLHQQGYAHSVECWSEQTLVGGLYGMAMGKVFFGESMFHQQPDASKIALVHLAEFLKSEQYVMIDCQVKTDHLISLGAEEIPRIAFCDYLRSATPFQPQRW